MISIIIPAYNKDTIRGAIDSILKQKISNLEIIIIDDSENKKIQQTIQHINHSDIKYYKNTRHLGTTLSRIRGIKIAQGDYIGFLDDDDLMINNNLEKKLKTINEGEIDFVFCDYIINNMMNNKTIKKNLCQYDEDFGPDLSKVISEEFEEFKWVEKSFVLDQIIFWKKKAYQMGFELLGIN